MEVTHRLDGPAAELPEALTDRLARVPPVLEGEGETDPSEVREGLFGRPALRR